MDYIRLEEESDTLTIFFTSSDEAESSRKTYTNPPLPEFLPMKSKMAATAHRNTMNLEITDIKAKLSKYGITIPKTDIWEYVDTNYLRHYTASITLDNNFTNNATSKCCQECAQFDAIFGALNYTVKKSSRQNLAEEESKPEKFDDFVRATIKDQTLVDLILAPKDREADLKSYGQAIFQLFKLKKVPVHEIPRKIKFKELENTDEFFLLLGAIYEDSKSADFTLEILEKLDLI